MARDRFENTDIHNVRLRLIGKRDRDGRRYNLPCISEVDALIVGDFDSADGERDIIVEIQSGLLRRISLLSPAYLPLQYPLLFPRGEDGYREDIPLRDSNKVFSKRRQKVSMREFMSYRIQDRTRENDVILYSQRGEVDPSVTRKRIIVPASFTNGARYMIQNYQDAMAICRWAGYPDLFITFTCNQNWIEITRALKRKGLKCEDRPDLVCRVFKMKLNQLIKEIKQGHVFGKVKSVIYTIEFQKRGLPHAHILIFLHSNYKYSNPEDLDKIISAEIPAEEEDPILYSAVTSLMIHGQCGVFNPHFSCMQDGNCTKYFPKKINDRTSQDEDGYPLYKRRDNGRVVKKGNNFVDNRFVVPHNPYLMKKYKAHINVEWCNQSRSIKYLFKYVNKGHDRVTASFYESSTDDLESNCQDEIKRYYDCRYLSPCEAAWRLFAFDIHYREPSVKCLPLHLPDEQVVIFGDDEPMESILDRPNIQKSKFLAWMEANKIFPEARDLTYAQYPMQFVWKQPLHEWRPRKRGFSVGRIHFVPPGSGELYYLRILLNIANGPTSYEQLRTINNAIYPTFKDACYAIGLLDDDKEYISRPEFVWNSTWHHLSDDILNKHRTLLQFPDLQLSEDQLKNFALAEIENILRSNNRSLANFPTMPQPDMSLVTQVQNRLIYDELNYDRHELAMEHSKLLSSLTDEQKTLRSRGEIVLTVASSGIAALLIPGGRTTHSRFVIPINVHEESTCNIAFGTPLAELIIKAKLIIWDEAPMTHKHCFEAVDRTLRDILKYSIHDSKTKPFGGKTVVFWGDFRQILPVIPKGTRQQVVFASINSSYLWKFCHVLTLTKNMRLQSNNQNLEEMQTFSSWVLSIGDGTIGGHNDGVVNIEIPDDLLIKQSGNLLQSIVEATYPSFLCKINDFTYLQQRAILAPTNEIVEEVNNYMLALMPGETTTYLSFDSPCPANESIDTHHDIHTPEFLNSITSSGLPNHELKLKIGVPVMLLRNIDQSSGLCNGCYFSSSGGLRSFEIAHKELTLIPWINSSGHLWIYFRNLTRVLKKRIESPELAARQTLDSGGPSCLQYLYYVDKWPEDEVNALKLLSASLCTNNVLTDVFLNCTRAENGAALQKSLVSSLLRRKQFRLGKETERAVVIIGEV
ncbi:hypothetical protein ACP275_12G088400 [Erythranthe tilingii]